MASGERVMPDPERGSSSYDRLEMYRDSVEPTTATVVSTPHVHMTAPSCVTVLDYDRRHLALYAALLDADEAGEPWRHVASTLMLLDIAEAGAEACWRSHLARARWIVGEGLGEAISAFERPEDI
jgi:hypothetical protein